MQYTSFGRTGLEVSVVGFGCGGYSRLGQNYDQSADHSVSLLKEALDLGVNFIDTSENYKTEEIVGEAIRGRPRSSVVVTTKTYVQRKTGLLPPADMLKSLEQSLASLGTDYIDVYCLHGVEPEAYDYAEAQLLPLLVKAKDAGKIRNIGISEHTSTDPEHETVRRAIAAGFDVVMFAFHMMHQNARDVVVPAARAAGVGTVGMCAMRGFFSNQEAVETVLRELEATGRLPYSYAESRDAIASLVADAGPEGLVDAAYRYARHEPGIDVVLFGTGKREHLRANVASMLKPPLPEADKARIDRLFGPLVSVALNKDLRGRPTPY
ncbi:MAG: hypothetical protein RLZ98_820 [Pseudomonadota bacterium]